MDAADPPHTTAEVDALDRAILEVLHALGSEMHAVGTRFAAREDLHPTDVQALSVLAMAGGQLTAGDLARALDLSTGATTRLVDRLERVGHVARTLDPVDRRRRQVSVTESARQTAGAYFGQLSRLIAAVLQEHDTAERRTILRFLTRVVAELQAPGEGRDTASHTTTGAPPGHPRPSES